MRPADGGPRPPKPHRRLTVQGWQNLVLSAMAIVVLMGLVIGGLLMHRTDDMSRDLIQKIQPARVAAYQMQAALRDQETAVRGYVIAGDKQFLEPYYAGQQVQKHAAEEIHRLVGTHADLMRDLDAIDQASMRWRTSYAEPLIALISHGGPGPATRELTERGKVEFDRLRALFETQNENLGAARTEGIRELDHMRHWRDGLAIAMVVAFVVLGVLLALLVRSAVTRPLDSLAAACRRITEGSFGERIVPRGPRDIRAIAAAVEDMRQRIVSELESSTIARATLDEQAEELRRSNAELEQFAYVASHDLQEPLRKVASFCQLLEKRYGDKLDERGVEYIGFAVDGAKRMQALINDLLTFSRVGRLNSAYSEVALDDALNTALSNLSTAIEESDTDIVRPPHPLPTIEGDPMLLTMLWQNLIGNAVKFRREGVAPRIVIDCEQQQGTHGSEWLLSVTDNGIGIGEDFADKVFVIFQRLHGRDEYSGTGIGLAICKKIVEHHGGTIWVDTSYSEGTRFKFTLPEPAPSEAEPEPSSDEAEPKPTTTASVQEGTTA
ncbi:CHASE3 domain-containing protein [Mycobacterium sp. 1274761.0]|uniref:sensor histidine kinase n=1 Tax=Mycobacterium sp. 1274761.0 TaxID=1834077 RepID=UPI0008019DD8|nr:sensor histidine kinase [Mycobacterium sp. 1274761.0]OBK76749.1 histidine kinase [Mycobacterium sp. 1274761.0]